MQHQVSETFGVPSPGGDLAESLIAAIWSSFCARQFWPSFVVIDQQLNRIGIQIEDARNELVPGLVRNLDSRASTHPARDQMLALTIGGIATRANGGDHVMVFMQVVRFALLLEREWDHENAGPEDQEPWFSMEEAKRGIALPPGAHGLTVLRQVLTVIDDEPWSAGYGGDGDARKFKVDRRIRDYVSVLTINEYWDVRDRFRRRVEVRAALPPAPTQVSPSSRVESGPGGINVPLHSALSKALALFDDGHVTEAADEALREVEARVKALAARVRPLPKDDTHGHRLMSHAFSPDKGPVLDVSRAHAGYDANEQDGMKFLFMGASKGLRNPINHKEYRPTDLTECAEILAAASLCMRRLDGAEERIADGI